MSISNFFRTVRVARGCDPRRQVSRTIVVSVLLVVAFCWGSLGESVTPNSTGETVFSRLRNLVGEWEGTFEWTGARNAPAPRMPHTT